MHDQYELATEAVHRGERSDEIQCVSGVLAMAKTEFGVSINDEIAHEIDELVDECADLGANRSEIVEATRYRLKLIKPILESVKYEALCLRLAVVIANHERGSDIASPVITL